MYTSKTPDEKVFAIKPMNCPGCIEVFNQGLKSYKDLPLKCLSLEKFIDMNLQARFMVFKLEHLLKMMLTYSVPKIK